MCEKTQIKKKGLNFLSSPKYTGARSKEGRKTIAREFISQEVGMRELGLIRSVFILNRQRLAFMIVFFLYLIEWLFLLVKQVWNSLLYHL